MKRVGWAALALAGAFSVGWLVGAAGRSGAEREAGLMAEHAAFLEIRGLVLEGRLDVLRSDFGDARQTFDEARAAIERLQTRLRETGLAERAGLLEVALGYLKEAGDRAVNLDADAGSAAEAALHAVDTVRGR